MSRSARVIGAVPGILLLLNGLGWLFQPDSAAANLGLPIPSSLDPMAISSLMGDVGALFLGSASMSLIATFTARRAWYQAAALLMGFAAFMRALAWLAYGAAFATQFIVIEVAMAAALLFAASKATD